MSTSTVWPVITLVPLAIPTPIAHHAMLLSAGPLQIPVLPAFAVMDIMTTGPIKFVSPAMSAAKLAHPSRCA